VGRGDRLDLLIEPGVRLQAAPLDLGHGGVVFPQKLFCGVDQPVDRQLSLVRVAACLGQDGLERR